MRTVKEPSFQTLIRSAEILLTLNCFSFGGNHCKQTNGVALGTKIGPSYAYLFRRSPNLISTVATLTTVSALPPLLERS